MRCKFCSAPLPQKGLICDYCGKRNPLNLNVLSKVDIEERHEEHQCPVCKVSFDNINIGLKKRVVIQRCNTCDGVFITEDILEELISDIGPARDKIDFHVLSFIKNNPRQKSETTISYRYCPVCDKMMQRYNYKSASGVVVDRCLRHGIWLDGGELKQLFEWKKAGGGSENRLQPIKPPIEPDTFERHHAKAPLFDPIGNFLTKFFGG